MDGALIHNWNATVSPNDDVYILGDFTLKDAAGAKHYLSQLVGRKHIIRGNHDVFLEEVDNWSEHFVWVEDYHLLKDTTSGRKLALFHYPIAEWDGFFGDTIHLYGHVHNSPVSNSRISDDCLAFNVGVDVFDFKPVSIDAIIRLADKKLRTHPKHR